MTKIIDPLKIRERIQEYGSRPTPKEFNPRAKGAIRGALNKAIEMTTEIKEGVALSKWEVNEARRLVMSWMVAPAFIPFKVYSSKDDIFTPQIWNGFSRWNSKRLPNGDYVQREAFKEEVWWTLVRARVDRNATENAVSGERIIFFDCLQRWEEEEDQPPEVADQVQTEFQVDNEPPADPADYEEDELMEMY